MQVHRHELFAAVTGFELGQADGGTGGWGGGLLFRCCNRLPLPFQRRYHAVPSGEGVSEGRTCTGALAVKSAGARCYLPPVAVGENTASTASGSF